MTLLFVQGGSRWKFDTAGNVYTDANFNDSVWRRYTDLCDEFVVLLRREEKVYSKDEASARFNRFNTEIAHYIAVPDIYRPVKNILNFKKRRQVINKIKDAVKNSDKVIIRSLGNLYTNTALKYARKYKKPYLVEVTGFAFDGLWYHSLRGKSVAVFKELQYKHLMRKVPFATYVTDSALQKRYPCGGQTLGCSDVELPPVNPDVLKNRIDKINNQSQKIILGTAAFLDVNWKGQKYVIKAIYKLKTKGCNNFEYQLIGSGSGKKLKRLIAKLNLENQVKIIGALPHDQVFDWLDSIDIYVQPSFQEGLCRAIVEAMSRACPVACSDVGGNYELASKSKMFKKGSVKQITDILVSYISKEVQIAEAKLSFERVKQYDKRLLDNKRNNFYKLFISMEQ